MSKDKTNSWHSPREVWAKLRPAAREMRHSATPAEDMVWEKLRARRFHSLRFRRQHAIGTFIVDFYCHEKRLIIEVDGGIHDSTGDQDAARQQYLEAMGFTVVRLKNAEVTGDLDRALARVHAACDLTLPSP